MKNKIVLFQSLTFSIILFFTTTFANNIEGNIVKLNLHNNLFTEIKEVFWQESDTSSYYIAAFSADTNNYLIKYCTLPYDENGPLEQTIALHKIVNMKNHQSTTYLYIGNFIRLSGLVFHPFHIYRADSGVWLFHDILGRAFVSNSDSIYPYFFFDEYKLIHIAGEIGNEQIAITFEQDKDSLYYYLDELNNMPYYDLNRFKRIYFDKKDFVVPQIMNLFENVFILINNYQHKFYSAVFIDNTFYIKDELKLDLDFPLSVKWSYNDEFLYLWHEDSLFKYMLDYTDTTFTDKKLLLTGNFYVDFDSLLCSKFEHNNLIIYDMNAEETINEIGLDSINFKASYPPLIDYPNVYIHQTKKYSTIERRYEILTEYYIFQNYPNPFNPSTNIRFNLPHEGPVTLEVFDMLGRKVATLLNEELNAGYHTIEFNSQNLNSGVYFYRIKADKFEQVKKMILLQ